MSPTIGFKIPNEEMKKEINDVLNEVADQYHLEIQTKADALYKLTKLYKQEFSTIGFRELPKSIHETMISANCTYIRWNDILSAFECYESYHRTRKKQVIDSEHDKVLDACTLCKKGKSDAIRKRVEEGFRKKGINNLFNLTKLLMRMDEEGAVAQIFLCQAKQFTDDEIIISPDCVHLKCPQKDSELVLIEEHCLKEINTFDMNPPCRYLVAPFLRVPIKPHPEAKAVMDEMAMLEKQNEKTEPINVESEVIEPDNTNEETEPKNARDIIAEEKVDEET